MENLSKQTNHMMAFSLVRCGCGVLFIIIYPCKINIILQMYIQMNEPRKWIKKKESNQWNEQNLTDNFTNYLQIGLRLNPFSRFIHLNVHL